MSLRLKTYSKTITFILSLILAVQLVSTDAIAYYPDTGRFAEAPLVAKYLKSISTSQDFVHVNIPASWPTYYNLWYYGVEYQKKEPYHEAGREFYIVHKRYYSIDDMTDETVNLLFDYNEMAIYQAVGSEAQ